MRESFSSEQLGDYYLLWSLTLKCQQLIYDQSKYHAHANKLSMKKFK